MAEWKPVDPFRHCFFFHFFALRHIEALIIQVRLQLRYGKYKEITECFIYLLFYISRRSIRYQDGATTL